MQPAVAPGIQQAPVVDTDRKVEPIVGAWFVKDSGAPFPYHMYVFNADGTMQQANPDAGDPHASDSDGKGIWVADGDRVRGKWVEITADRASHQFTGRTEISYDIKVNADAFAGTMGQLLIALETGQAPAISGRDNLKTMALVDAAYLSAVQKRSVKPSEIVSST